MRWCTRGMGIPKVKWYVWLTGVCSCSGTQTNFPVSYLVKLAPFSQLLVKECATPWVAVAHVAACYILKMWCLCCQSSRGTQNFFVSMVAHIALVSREQWQSWWPQFTQVRVTGRMARPVKLSDLNSTWWTLQRIAFQAVLVDTVVEHAPRLPRPVVSRVW